MDSALSIAAIAAKFQDWNKRHRSPNTGVWYDGHLSRFLAYLGDGKSLPLSSLKPFHVVEWSDSESTWGNTHKRGGIGAVQRLCSWAEQMGYIDTTPLRKVSKPPAGRRDNPMSPDDFEAILGWLDQGDPFRVLFQFIWTTGCRPQEARHIEPRHVQLERARIVFPAIESKGKRHPRVIYLHGLAHAIITRLMQDGPEGKLFRNARGRPWTKHAICNRMQRLSEITGKPMAMYDARHGFATRKLVQGHDHLTIAELMGHRDGTMLAKVYGHLDRDVGHLLKALAD